MAFQSQSRPVRSASRASRASHARPPALSTSTSTAKSSTRPLPRATAQALMTTQLDLATQIGLPNKYLDETPDASSEEDESTREHPQAQKLTTQLLDGLSQLEKQLSDQWLEDDVLDYQNNGDVLDQKEVDRKMKLLRDFALHLRRVGQNRSMLLAKLKEPMAQEHWLLEPKYHEQMVSTFSHMAELVNGLPEIVEAARHCLNPRIEENRGGVDKDRARQIAQIENTVHKVELIFEQLEK
ncbi:hypothetical protein GGI07_002706 [Coemansia sp. Benny D115]|nr:hypothetical protein GGI07_002706 [Coemansia sp. Benny D115]